MQQLDDNTTLRYHKHILLPQMNEEGQEHLMNSHVLVIGAGGLGCAVLPYLVASGIGKITLFDGDNVELSNLQRQILHHETNIAMPKVLSALQWLQPLNQQCTIDTFVCDFSLEYETLITQVDIVVDCSDRLNTRLLLNRLCWQYQVPLVSGAAIRTEGQVISFMMQPHEPCYGCLAALFSEQTLSCMESGVLSPLVGTIGTLQATEVLRRLLKWNTAAPRLLLYDAFSLSFTEFTLHKHPECSTCGSAFNLADSP